jgi:hypothetical protein
MEYESDDEEYNITDKDNLSSMLFDVFKRVNLKMGTFLFFIMMIVLSDFFVNNTLSDNYKYADTPNTKGTLVQIVIITLLYLFLDLMVSFEVI